MKKGAAEADATVDSGFASSPQLLMLSGKAEGGVAMRMMLKILIPTEAGNHTIKDGSLRKILEATMSKLKPEAAYFVAQDGLRSAMMFFDMQEVSDIPGIVEPLFMGFNAEVELLPVMNAEDLKMGLDAAMQGM